MLSRALFRTARRSAPQISQATPRSYPGALPSPPLAFRRFESHFKRNPFPPRPQRPERIKHTRWNEEDARNAKPFFPDGGFASFGRSRQTQATVLVVVVGGTVFYVYHLETVPVSGRRRFNCYSDESVEHDGEIMYRITMQDATNAGALLPEWDSRSRMVQRVMDRLIPASGMENQKWEVHVIDSKEMNAFVIPGGKVFVYSGILPVAQTDDGLAAILGHEIAHNVARHAAEAKSSLVLLEPFRWAIMIGFNIADSTGLTFGLGQALGPWLSSLMIDFGIARPASRQQESEADYIGLMMMAKSCYDPEAAAEVWRRMEQADKNGIPQWMSTHPSHVNRIAKMQEWLPKAESERDGSDCHQTTRYARGFQDAFGGRLFA